MKIDEFDTTPGAFTADDTTRFLLVGFDLTITVVSRAQAFLHHATLTLIDKTRSIALISKAKTISLIDKARGLSLP